MFHRKFQGITKQNEGPCIFETVVSFSMATQWKLTVIEIFQNLMRKFLFLSCIQIAIIFLEEFLETQVGTVLITNDTKDRLPPELPECVLVESKTEFSSDSLGYLHPDNWPTTNIERREGSEERGSTVQYE